MVRNTTSYCVPRRRSGGESRSRIRLRRVEIIFQSYPGVDSDSGISGLDYQLQIARRSSSGRTGDDGKVVIHMSPGTRAALTIMGTTYDISLTRLLHPRTSIRGVKQRLNTLGYNAGTVNETIDAQAEYALLNFQADNNPLRPDGLANDDTKERLHTKMGEA